MFGLSIYLSVCPFACKLSSLREGGLLPRTVPCPRLERYVREPCFNLYVHVHVLQTTWYVIMVHTFGIGIFEPPKCDVNPQPNTWGIGPLVGRTTGNRCSVMHVLAVILSITYHFFFICQYIFIRVIWSAREICPLLMYPSTFLLFL